MGGGEWDDDGAAAAEISGSNSEGVIVNVRSSDGSKFSLQIKLEASVEALKTVLSQKCGVTVDQQRLIYKGRILKDDQTLQSYGLERDHTIHLVRGLPPAAANTGGEATARVPNSTENVTTIGSNDSGPLRGSGFGGSLFSEAGMGGSGGLFGAGLPEFEQVQQQLSRNPNIMREMMSMPVVQNLMNNPDIMRNMIMNNPQMREIIDRNPELGHVLNDPSTLRQTLEAARNPELMREMMRNTDRAMSNIESSPEGFNMLRRMYETVQEPFLNATTMAGNTGNDSSATLSALLGTQGGNQARDGSTETTASDNTTVSSIPNSNPLPNPWAAAGTAGGAQATRSNPFANRPQTPSGLGGLSLPRFESMSDVAQDTNSINQLLQNPAITQMAQGFLSNPQSMNQINSQLQGILQNPELLRQLSSPETMQQMLTFQQSLSSHLGQLHSASETDETGGGTGLDALMSMFGGLGAGSLAVPNRSDVPPDELYATQLSQLQDMGFFDTQENIRALMATAGNVHAAVERLLGNSGQ